MIKKKIIWIAALAAGALFCASCGEQTMGKTPVLPPEIQAGNNETKEMFTLDETGLFATVKNVSNIEYNKEIPQTYKDLGNANLSETGVRVSGTAGATFYYTPVVNLNDIQGQNIVSFEVPHNDEFKMSGVTMEVIDIYDAQNKFTVTWFVKSNSLMSNVLIGCNGVSKGNNNESGYTLGYPRLEYGVTAYSVSFVEETKYGHLPFHFTYDMQTAQVQGKFRETDGALQMYLDLDNPVHMGEENVFEGFTTGEVYLKFIFDEVASGDTGAIILTDIAGKSLAGETLKAESSNIIKLDMDSEYRKEMPVGEKGKPYFVPMALPSDLFAGECNVGCQVTSPSGIDTVITDGVYTPAEVGEYEVLYSTKDVNGFNVMKKIYFDVVESVTPLELSTDVENGSVLSAGKSVALPKPFAVGGSGIANVVVQYSFNGAAILPDEDGCYAFADKGELKVTATAVDYLGTSAQASFAYTVEETATFTLVAPLPKALTAGLTYYFPDFSGKVVGDSTVALAKSITVNGEVLAASRKFVVPESGVLSVVYTVGAGTEYETSKTFTINVLAASDTLNVSDLFAVNETTSISTNAAGVVIQATGKNARADFVHPISANYAGMFFQPTDTTKDFEYLEITLTDALNSENAVSFRVYKDTAMFDNFQTQNRAGEYAMRYRLLHTVADLHRMSFYYDNDTQKIYNYNNIEVAPLEYTTSGKTFKGFEGGSMYVSATLCNAAAGASICLARLGNQSLDAELLAYGDIIKPQLATKNVVSDKTISLNGTYTVQKAAALDVLQAKSSVKVSLLSPKGEKILNEASCTEDRTFTFTELGGYKLTYLLEDGVSGKERLEYVITVEDSIAPTITLKGAYKSTYRVGEKLKLLDVTVTDDISARENITLYVIVYPADYLPDYHKVGDSYLLATEGHYNVTYYAIDEAGNRAYAKFDIYVK